MRKVTLALCLFIALFALGCSGSFQSPTSPGDNYSGGYGSYDSGPVLSRNMEGEWEGFMYEQDRSDNLPLDKKIVSMKCAYLDTSWYGSNPTERVQVEVLIDGHPSALTDVDVTEQDYFDLVSNDNDIDLEMQTSFDQFGATGDMYLAWTEKVELPDSDKADMHYVEITGNFELSKARGSQWADAWKLFDQYGKDAFNLPASTWSLATQAGLAHAASLNLSTPVKLHRN